MFREFDRPKFNRPEFGDPEPERPPENEIRDPVKDDPVKEEDTMPPSILSLNANTTNVTLSESNTQQTVTFTATIVDNTSVSSALLSGMSPSNVSNTTYTFIKTYRYSDTSIPGGSSNDNLVLVATDPFGNTSTRTIRITILRSEFTMIDPTYYIDIVADLNASIMNENGSFHLPSSVVDKNNPMYQARYNLPSGEINLNSGSITARDTNGSPLGDFATDLRIVVDDTGTMSSQLTITGKSITHSVADNPSTAQHAYWRTNGSTAPSIQEDSADSLSATLTLSDVKNMMQSEISQIESIYSGEVVLGWQAELMEIRAVMKGETPNILDQFASQYGRSFPAIFNDGEYIVIETKYDYEISINDMNGETRIIVPSTPIYARITQDSRAPMLNP